MLEVSLPFYRQRARAMPLESELLTKESLEHGKSPSWKDLPEAPGIYVTDFKGASSGLIGDLAGNRSALRKKFRRQNGTRVPVVVGAAAFDERRDQAIAFGSYPIFSSD